RGLGAAVRDGAGPDEAAPSTGRPGRRTLRRLRLPVGPRHALRGGLRNAGRRPRRRHAPVAPEGRRLDRGGLDRHGRGPHPPLSRGPLAHRRPRRLGPRAPLAAPRRRVVAGDHGAALGRPTETGALTKRSWSRINAATPET